MGGSSWSAAARCGTKIATATVKAIRLTNLSACFLITKFSPETRAEQLWICAAVFFGRLGSRPECRSAKYELHTRPEHIGHFWVCRISKGPILLQAIKHLQGGR